MTAPCGFSIRLPRGYHRQGRAYFNAADLEDLSREAEKQGCWEFLLPQPLAVTGGSGSPLNPIATF